MSASKPNRIHVCHQETVFGLTFGGVHSVTPIHFPGPGHVAHIEARFVGGVRLDLTPEVLTEFIREGQTALAKLCNMPDIHDAVGEETW